jgi:hypothetical protein
MSKNKNVLNIEYKFYNNTINPKNKAVSYSVCGTAAKMTEKFLYKMKLSSHNVEYMDKSSVIE